MILINDAFNVVETTAYKRTSTVFQKFIVAIIATAVILVVAFDAKHFMLFRLESRVYPGLFLP
jgi:hypothetical protein